LNCSKCDKGRYESNGECISCIAGTYQDKEGEIACISCPIGMYSVSGSEICIECGNEGFGSLEGCVECSVGEELNIDGTGCERCSVGKYNDKRGRGRCEECSPGTYSGIGAWTCTGCGNGEYQNLSGQSSCLKCGIGKESSNDKTGCIDCTREMYSNEETEWECLHCGKGWYPNNEKSDCIFCGTGKQVNNESDGCEECKEDEYSDESSDFICVKCINDSVICDKIYEECNDVKGIKNGSDCNKYESKKGKCFYNGESGTKELETKCEDIVDIRTCGDIQEILLCLYANLTTFPNLNVNNTSSSQSELDGICIWDIRMEKCTEKFNVECNSLVVESCEKAMNCTVIDGL
jgi:hypothetical protein